MLIARNIAAGLLLFVTTVLVGVLTVISSPHAFLPFVKRLAHLYFSCLGVRVSVRGLEHLQASSAYVFLSNHVTVIDHFLYLAVLPGHMVGLEKIQSFRLPIYGWVARRWGQVPIDRDDLQSGKDACRIIQQRLVEGTHLVLFPEGTRTRTGNLGPFKKGPFHIAIDTGANVVPVVMRGMSPIYGRGKRLIRSGPVEIIVGEPICCARHTKEDLVALSDSVRHQMRVALGELPPSP